MTWTLAYFGAVASAGHFRKELLTTTSAVQLWYCVVGGTAFTAAIHSHFTA